MRIAFRVHSFSRAVGIDITSRIDPFNRTKSVEVSVAMEGYRMLLLLREAIEYMPPVELPLSTIYR